MTAVVAQNNDSQRYVGLQLLNLDPRPEAGMDIIEASINNGCNLVALTIQWDEVYKNNTSPPDWRQYDRQIEYIAKTNAKIALRIIVGRLSYRLNGFWTPKETMKDDLGRPVTGIYDRTCFSFSHQPTVTKSQNFIREVCRRYNSYQNQGKILYISFGNLATQELGYPHETNFEGGKQYLAGFDYSDSSLDSFRIWAEKRYKRINKLNYHWGTKHTSFQTLFPPRTAYNPYPAYQTKAGKDWYIFSHSQLKNYIDQTIAGIKQINPQYKIVNEYGAVTADFSAMLVSYGFKSLDQKADGSKVHNDPYYNHRWITDVLRSNSPNRWVLNEVFFTSQTPYDLLVRQFNECFEHGSKVVTLVISSPEAEAMRMMREVANRWINAPLAEIKPSQSISYTLTESLDSTMKNVEKRWLEKVGYNPRPVHIELKEDILSDEYWKPLSNNVLPIVTNQITERGSKPRKSFSYTLPKDAFTDPDGDIVKIEAVEKPQWLGLSNGVLSGNVPDILGDNRITLRATDDEGATVTMSFNLKVTNINIKPLARRPVPDLEGSLNQLIFYQFQGDHFDDPDGVIVRVRASGLRSWMTYTPKEFSAYPQEQGTFTVTLRAYDDDSAFVETSFKVKVLNKPPVARQVLPEKIIAVNKAFRFKISPNLFTDPDGEVVRVGAAKLPSWLRFTGTELQGTPAELGTYRVGIRAYDNGGDSVEIPFVIKVDLQGAKNLPPVARYSLPNVQLFSTQKFSYRVPDSLFYDTNGYVDKIETPNLPSWLTFKNNEIAGVAMQAGTYTVTIRAIDDDETAADVTFTINVRYAAINFELIQAGKVGERRFIGPLSNDDILLQSSIPEKITIYANCEAPVKKVRFKLTGPYQKITVADRFPFALFDETAGFTPVAGTYTLEATAFNDSLQVSAATIRFKIQTTQPLSDWQVYPNPFSEVCNLKLPKGFDRNSAGFNVVSLSGQTIFSGRKEIMIIDDVAYIDLTPYRISPNIYFLQVLNGDTVEKVIKISKQ
ncbi:putative Ig domain-containing protein [Runella slithyformis]|nr:putative Ig domain-containing protein [Runella slithyformis]